jgi:hypothetical protein
LFTQLDYAAAGEQTTIRHRPQRGQLPHQLCGHAMRLQRRMQPLDHPPIGMAVADERPVSAAGSPHPNILPPDSPRKPATYVMKTAEPTAASAAKPETRILAK